MTHLVVLPHLVGDKVSVLKLIDESVTRVINEQTTDTTQCLGGKELDLCVWVFGVDETGRVDLDLFEVDTLCSDGHGHLVAVTGTVVAVGSWLKVS